LSLPGEPEGTLASDGEQSHASPAQGRTQDLQNPHEQPGKAPGPGSSHGREQAISHF